MITIKLPHKLSEQDKQFIEDLQKQQSPMIRSAYKFASYGLAEISVRSDVRNRFTESKLDSWFQQSAVKAGIGMFSADNELGVKNRIFGGKKNYIRRTKNLISSEEWKKSRLLPVYLIGESPAKGNRKFDFYIDQVVFKPWCGHKITIQLPLLKKNWNKLWSGAIQMANAKKLPITVSLDQEYIYLSFCDKKVKKHQKSLPNPIKTRYAGIDMNPNYIGISVFDGNRLVDTKLFCLSDLTGKNKNENKIAHETREIAHQIGKWLTHLRVNKLFVEKLNFKSDSMNKGKSLNRLCKNQWKRSVFTSTLNKYFPKLYEINAAYTSTIGNVLRPDLPDPVASSTEIAQRGYRLVVNKSKKFYPELPTTKKLEDRWKETEFPVFSSWTELHDFIKNLGLKYRVPIPERGGFRVFSSLRSYVGVL